MCCCLGFRPPAGSLDSHRSCFGPACGCCSASLRIALLAEQVTEEKARPASGAARLAARLPSHWWPGSAPSHDGVPRPLRCSPGVHASRPLRNTSTRPPDGIELRVACKHERWLWRCFLCTTCHAPFRRVSAVVVSGRERHGRGERTRRALLRRSRSAGGMRDPMERQAFFACFWGPAIRRVKEVNRPAGRNQALEPLAERLETEASAGTRSASAKGWCAKVASAEPAAKSPARRPCRSYRPTATAPTASCAAR